MRFSGFATRLKALCVAGFVSLVVLVAAPAFAGPVDDAIAAANAGNHAEALDILEPLARRGHPDDYMQQDADARILFVMITDRFRTRLFNEGGNAAEHENAFRLAYEIAHDAASSEKLTNWGMRYYLARMYLYGAGSTVEQAETGVAMLQEVADSGDRVYANQARTTLCDEWIEEYCGD